MFEPSSSEAPGAGAHARFYDEPGPDPARDARPDRVPAAPLATSTPYYPPPSPANLSRLRGFRTGSASLLPGRAPDRRSPASCPPSSGELP